MRPKILLLVAISALAPTLVAPPSTARLRLGPEGDVHAWLVAGPFPNPGAPDEQGSGLGIDWLPQGENQADPAEGDVARAGSNPIRWKLGIATRLDGLDFIEVTRHFGAGVAYAFTALESDQDREVQILFGTDDGVRLYVNGEQVFEKSVRRGVKRDEDKAVARLRKGRNRLLFKVDQGRFGWGLMARVVGADGKPISGVTQVLELEPATSGADAAQEPPGASTARLVRGRSGALDLAAAIEYEAWHRRIARWVSRLRDRADDPDRLESELRRAEIALRAAAVQDADEASRSLSSGRSRIEAEWRRARATWAGSVQDPEPLVKVDAGKEDFVRVMTGGRHFTHSDGRAFIPIGYNHNPDWTTLRHSDPDAESYDPKVTDRWFQNLKDHGVNLVRLMIETPTSGNLEETIGVLEPEHVLWLDNVFLAARKHGVKLMVTPYDTFWMNQRWDTTHYNPALRKGGMIHEKIQFITSRQAIEAQKRRLRFLVDRYGNLGEVFCWEILNEADIWWGATPAQLKAWSDDIVSFLKAYQKKKWGRTHLVTMSFAEGMPKAELAELAFREPGYDLATTHLYVGITKAPKSRDDAIGAGLAIGRGVRHALSEIRDARPYIDGENGPIDDWIEDEKLDDEVFHAMSWGHLCSGGSGSSLRWPYRNPHHLTPGMLRYLKSMRAFVDGVDWRSMTGPVRSEELTGTGVAGVQVTTDRASLVWLMGRGGMPPVVRLKDFEGQHYRMFDTRLGKWLASGTLSGELRAPAGVDSIALHIVKRR